MHLINYKVTQSGGFYNAVKKVKSGEESESQSCCIYDYCYGDEHADAAEETDFDRLFQALGDAIQTP